MLPRPVGLAVLAASLALLSLGAAPCLVALDYLSDGRGSVMLGLIPVGLGALLVALPLVWTAALGPALRWRSQAAMAATLLAVTLAGPAMLTGFVVSLLSLPQLLADPAAALSGGPAVWMATVGLLVAGAVFFLLAAWTLERGLSLSRRL
jgi:hypothetical protein